MICVFKICVLNLQVAMRPEIFSIFIVLVMLFPSWKTQEGTLPRIISPQGGEALLGMVMVHVEVEPSQTIGYELSYSYQSGQTETWFVIAENQISNTSKIQTIWDTTTISDGSYRLRVKVFLNNGLSQEVMVDGLRVRNYSIIETNTPTSIPLITGTPIPPTATLIKPTPGVATPMPENALQFGQELIRENIKRGILVVLGVFGLMGIYSTIKNIRRKG